MAINVSREKLLAFRTRRQYLAAADKGATPDDVLTILKRLQPFPPVAGSMPGSAPVPTNRVKGFEMSWSDQWRKAGRLIKGRFMHGNLAYVALEDLGLYAAAYRRPMRHPVTETAQRVLRLLKDHGPLSKKDLRVLSDFDRRHLDRALLTLNRAFEVMELQRELNWDSPWDRYERAFPDSSWRSWGREEAQLEMLDRFTRCYGPATMGEMAAWSGFGDTTVRPLVEAMLTRSRVEEVVVAGEDVVRYVAADLLEGLTQVTTTDRFVAVFPPNDPLILPQYPAVLVRYRALPFPYCYGVVVRDSEVVGAAWGHYRRSWIHIEDIALERTIVSEPQLVSQILLALEKHTADGRVAIHVHGINGEAEAPWIREVFYANDYHWRDGYYIKEAWCRAETTS